MVAASVNPVSVNEMEEVRGKPAEPGKVVRGHWHASKYNPWGIIYVVPSVHISMDDLEETIHHERCHAKLYVYTGDPDFHH